MTQHEIPRWKRLAMLACGIAVTLSGSCSTVLALLGTSELRIAGAVTGLIAACAGIGAVIHAADQLRKQDATTTPSRAQGADP